MKVAIFGLHIDQILDCLQFYPRNPDIPRILPHTVPWFYIPIWFGLESPLNPSQNPPPTGQCPLGLRQRHGQLPTAQRCSPCFGGLERLWCHGAMGLHGDIKTGILWMGQRHPKSEINHQFGMVESLETVGCLPSINGWRISHPSTVWWRLMLRLLNAEKSLNWGLKRGNSQMDDFPASHVWLPEGTLRKDKKVSGFYMFLPFGGLVILMS